MKIASCASAEALCRNSRLDLWYDEWQSSDEQGVYSERMGTERCTDRGEVGNPCQDRDMLRTDFAGNRQRKAASSSLVIALTSCIAMRPAIKATALTLLAVCVGADQTPLAGHSTGLEPLRYKLHHRFIPLPQAAAASEATRREWVYLDTVSSNPSAPDEAYMSEDQSLLSAAGGAEGSMGDSTGWYQVGIQLDEQDPSSWLFASTRAVSWSY